MRLHQRVALRVLSKQFKVNLSENVLMRAIYQNLYPDKILMFEDNPQAYIRKVYHVNAIFASVIDLVASKAAEIDVELVRERPDGEVEVVTDHELCEIAHKPNWEMTFKELIELQIKFDMITGNDFYYSPRPDVGNNRGRIPQDEAGNYLLFSAPPQLVKIVSGGALNPVSGYLFGNYYVNKAAAWDVLHVKTPTTDVTENVRLFGESPAKSLRSELSISNQANISRYGSFKNNGAHGIINLKDEELAAEKASQLKQQWATDNDGADKMNKVAVVGGVGDIQYLNTSRSNVEMEVLESELQTLRKVCAKYQVPSGLLGDPQGSTYNNKKEESKALYINACLPRFNKQIGALNGWLMKHYQVGSEKLYYRANTSNIAALQQDNKELWGWLAMADELTPNQKLKIAGLEQSDLKEMNLHWFPAGKLPIEDYARDIDEETVSKFLDEHNIQDYK